VTFNLQQRGVEVVVLDIEGTTTPIAFVYDVLFPYARAHLRQHLRDLGRDDLRKLSERLHDEWREEPARGETPPHWSGDTDEQTIASVEAYVEWLMARDRKSPGLKTLQGQIWEGAYRAGLLKGEVFADVPPALERWHAAGFGIAIYSSGSVLAQRLLFEDTQYGDLTRFISNFFDTATGPKTAPESYGRIANTLDCRIGRLLFISDVKPEIDAARSAGCQCLLCVRPGNPPQRNENRIEIVHTFDEIM
jgi:enolase-phosphatase E1